ncbi:HAMP domain-containing protein [Paenibacillus sp. UNCCL117]|uniref:sensor histidine kinase n=1 Tax=unclassified Paenibacillus TaxID=185978 RepID=UPI00088EC1A6|nr:MULTISPECIES: sensor histidine kinase [unclassified Paenibacillus]SDC52197.1 HAMP domain-containing protein [Paenibacillus sp. cl123]SFW11344.1 HAMP domain-containing protein [Paenibacillus sp. UNCCL117]
MKLRSKFLASFVVLIVITTLMISTVNYFVSVDAIRRNSGEFSQYLLRQVGITLEKRTADVEELVFRQYRSSSLSEQLSLIPETNEKAFDRDKYISDFMNSLMFDQDYFQAVQIIDRYGRSYAIERSNLKYYQQELMEKLRPDDVLAARGRALWFRGAKGTVFMARAIYDVPTNNYRGILAVGLDSGYINSIVKDETMLIGADIFFLNDNNELLIREQQQSPVVQYIMENRLFESQTALKNGFTYMGKRYMLKVLATDYDKWKILQAIDISQLIQGTDVIKYWTIGTMVTALVVAFLLAAIISKSITANVRMLLHTMSSFALDIHQKVIVPKGRDEIGLLAEKFNLMVERIHELFNTVYLEKLLKQKAEYRTLQFEYKALQAQMNPHFLYNTLEAIHSLAKIKGQDEIGEMVYLLGRLLRESIRRKGDVIPLSEEIGFIGDYLSIHKMIYGDKIQVQYNLDEKLMGHAVPKFILQPIVENAVIHGIEKKPGVGEIHIECRRDGGDLRIVVRDNGIGMDKETIERLLHPERYNAVESKEKHTNVGIISVHKRIRILYGDDYGISIESEIGEGSSVQIRIPLFREPVRSI